MGTVKYTGPVASFHCPTNAEIRSLKVHFSPKQEGTGDPSPENVRPISGWTGCNVWRTGVNVWDEQWERGIINNDGSVSTAISRIVSKNFIPVKEGQKYCYVVPGGTGRGAFYDENKNLVQYYPDLPLNYNSTMKIGYFTVPAGAKYLKICPTVAYGATYNNDISINYPSTDHAYHSYQGSTTNYEFGVLGKNKFDPKYKDINEYNIAGAYAYYYTEPIYLIPNTTYTIKPNSSGTIDNWYWTVAVYIDTYNVGDTATFKYVFNNTTYGSAYTFTTGPSGVIRYATNNRTKFEEIIANVDIQLELGSTATAYEPYDPNHTVYGGWVDLITGEVCEEWWKILIPSSLSSIRGGTGGFVDNTAYQGETWTHRYFILSKQLNQAKDVVSDKLVKGNCGNSAWKWGFDGTGLLHYSLGNESIGVTAETSASDRDTAVSNWLANNPITLVYHLATPNTYHIAPTQLTTFLGQNNVWSNADYVEVEYDLHETQSILARKQFIVANQPHIATPAAAPLQSFTTDVPAPLKECKVHFMPIQDLNGEENPYPPGGGVNIWDEEWEAGNIDSFTGVNNSNDGIRSKNYIPCLPDTTYYIYPTATDNSEIKIIQYDVNKDYIKYSWHKKTSHYTTESNTQYLRFSTLGNYGSTYNNDISINYPSTDTSYHPYSNICPIEGWTGVEVKKCGKNLFDISTLSNRSGVTITDNTIVGTINNLRYYHDGHPEFTPFYIPAGTTFVAHCTIYTEGNASTTGDGVYLVFHYDDDTFVTAPWHIKNSITTSTYCSGIVTAEKNIVKYSWSYGSGGNNIWHISNLQIELGSTATEYEPYTGTTIPITFPATTNLFNGQWEQGNIEVGNDAGSSTCMRTGFINVNPSTSYYLYTPRENNVFVFEYLEDGTYANKVNSVLTSHTFTTGSTTTKIRIVDRNSGTETVNTGINYPATNTYYEPYGIIYGGYVDLVTGDVWKIWHKISVDENTPFRLYTADFRDQGKSCNASYWLSSVNAPTAANYEPYSIDGFCNKLPYLENNYAHTDRASAANSTFEIALEGTRTQEEFLAWMAINSPITICYRLATPTLVTTLTPTQLKTLRGTNNIWASNGGDNIEIAYWTHQKRRWYKCQ